MAYVAGTVQAFIAALIRRTKHMSGPVKAGVYLLLAVAGVVIALSILKFVVFKILSLVVPIAIVGIIALIAYNYIDRKAIGRGGRSLP